MKTLIPLLVLAATCFGVGLISATLLLLLKKKRAALKTAAALFALPVAAALLVFARDDWKHREMQARLAYVKELCAKYGGEKIYRTVDNVEGVFQMKARNPDPEGQRRDQYGMVDPWGAAIGDSETFHLAASISFFYGGTAYAFVEQQPPFGSGEGPPYRRSYYVGTGRTIGDEYPAEASSRPEIANKPLVKLVVENVNTLKSDYGFYFEDLSTKELRARWISSGRLRIVDLRTKEVIAERTGYGLGNPKNRVSWSSGDICMPGESVGSTLRRTLRPISQSMWIERAGNGER